MLECGLENVEAALELDLSGVIGATDGSFSSSLASLSLVRTGGLTFPVSFLGTTRTCAGY